MLPDLPQDIMIVDDKAENLELFKDLLQAYPYTLRCFSSAGDALEAIKKKLPDLILLDVKMPVMDGYEMCRILKADPRFSAIPVIFVSALHKTAEKVEAFRAGGVDYITKPFEPEELIARMETHLQIKTYRAQLERYQNELEQRVQSETQKRLDQEKIILQQSRFAAMGELISMIAHQWRQPLGAVASTLAGLQIKMRLNDITEEQISAKLDEINTYIQDISLTIDDFRNFYQHSNIKSSKALSATMAASLAVINANYAAHGIRVTCMFKTEEPIESYHTELMQVFINILINAQDIFSQKQPKERKVIITIEQTGENRQCVSIRDNAGGIPEAIMEKIYDPYFSTKESLNGSGLGLYMAKTIIEGNCKGKISARNREGGAEFIIELNT